MEIDTRMRDMEDRTRAMGWATTDADAPVMGIVGDDVVAVCLSLLITLYKLISMQGKRVYSDELPIVWHAAHVHHALRHVRLAKQALPGLAPALHNTQPSRLSRMRRHVLRLLCTCAGKVWESTAPGHD